MLALVLALTAWADTPKPPDSFASLSHVEAAGWGHVWYDPAVSTVVNQPLDGYEQGAVMVLETRLQASEKATYNIAFTPGPSDDPQFVVMAADGTEIAVLDGEQLYLPGNGNLYVSGRANQMFDKRRKYRLQGQTIVEAKQPMYYVGLDTTVTRPQGAPPVLSLYSQQAEGGVVATLPVGAPIQVLVNDGDWYLVRTSFGLTGWTRVPAGTFASMIGVTFAGD